jgi:hypothetical protein
MRCPDELLERVDEARGDVPREKWLRRAVERALSDDTQAGALRGDDGHRTRTDPSPTGTVSARGALGPSAPAEQPQKVRGRVFAETRQHLPTCKCPMCK